MSSYQTFTNAEVLQRAYDLGKQLGLEHDAVTAHFTHLQHNGEVVVDPKRGIETYIDHTILKPQVLAKDVIQLCKEAVEHKFAAVCVNSCRVPLAKQQLSAADAATKIACVVGFPLGATSTASKVFEAKDAVEQGAAEIDMVMNVGKFLDGEYDFVYNDIHQVAKSVPCCKVIFETALIPTAQQLMDANIIAVLAGAHFVKTSTGFVDGGAKVEHIKLMRQVVGEKVKVKASGGIRTREEAEKFIALGIERIGTSSGVAIVKGSQGVKGAY